MNASFDLTDNAIRDALRPGPVGGKQSLIGLSRDAMAGARNGEAHDPLHGSQRGRVPGLCSERLHGADRGPDRRRAVQRALGDPRRCAEHRAGLRGDLDVPRAEHRQRRVRHR